MGKIIGIDLGTTNSCVAVMEGGEPKVIPNAEGFRTTPSVVAFTKTGERLVGLVAQAPGGHQSQEHDLLDQALHGPQVRRGRRTRSSWFPTRSVRGAERRSASSRVGDKELLAARDLRDDPAEDEADGGGLPRREGHRGGDHRARLLQRQPAPGDQGRRPHRRPRRQAHHQRAHRGGARLRPRQEEGREDRGLRPGRRHVRHLDPRDRRRRLRGASRPTATRTWAATTSTSGSSTGWPTSSRSRKGSTSARTRWRSSASRRPREKAKIELSTVLETEVNLPFITADQNGPKHLNMTLTRAKLEQLVDDLIERTRGPCMQALEDAGLNADEIDEVVLVGGATRMPKVQELVKEIFGKEPHKGVNPDEVVAIGAAIQGGVLAGDVRTWCCSTSPRCRSASRRSGGVMTTLIARNTTIPTKKSEVFSTAARQPDHGRGPRAPGRAPDGRRTTRRSAGSISTASRRRRAACRRSRSRSTSTRTASCTSRRRTGRPARSRASASRPRAG